MNGAEMGPAIKLTNIGAVLVILATVSLIVGIWQDDDTLRSCAAWLLAAAALNQRVSTR